RPAGSVWYSWTAPSDDGASFSVTPHPSATRATSPQDAPDSPDKTRVDVFRGDRIAGLEPVGSGEWGVQFFPTRARTYLIRVGYVGRAVPLTLNWSAGPRPVNDDVAAAAVLEDASGSVEGTNAGATLESGEFFGELAATVWYRWTAPADGSWKFESGAADLRVLAFTGERLSELRLVSGLPDAQAVFPARGGDVYRIAVASQDAYVGGQAFELMWDNHDRVPVNDDFAGAEDIASGGSPHAVYIDRDATVEPGEPAGSGIRTKWWTWTADADGRHVWWIDELTRETTWGFRRVMLSVFAGESLEDLQLVATNGERMSANLHFSAEGGRRYWISVGFPAADLWAYVFDSADATLEWGAAPENDGAAGAVALVGASGSMSGSNAFATNAYGERSVDVGRQTLWYALEAPAAESYRFAVDGDGGPWVLTVYRDAADGSGLDWVASNVDGTDHVRFEVGAGVRYMVVVGVRGGGRGGEFTLRWGPVDPSPVRYVGRLADGDRDSRGNPVEIRDPSGLAMHPDNSAVYLASGIGLQVFERDRRTGRLDHAQLIEPDYPLYQVVLLWDPGRDRLLADNCATGDWHAFGLVGAGPELKDLGRVTGHPGTCAITLLMDRTGSDLYRISTWNYVLAHFAVEEDGAIRAMGDYDLLAASRPDGERPAAVLSNDGRHIYVAIADLLQVFERDPDPANSHGWTIKEPSTIWDPDTQTRRRWPSPTTTATSSWVKVAIP
ncbi:MAG: hypothetical protein OXH15_17445, partial [Gammaproteobacteria bacterium]|nr:hypothetical protein [Gammaproteobacteria bacterium]